MMDKFTQIREGVLQEIDEHRREIECGELRWFSIKVNFNGAGVKSSWQQEQRPRDIVADRTELLLSTRKKNY